MIHERAVDITITHRPSQRGSACDWRAGLPVLTVEGATLRELCPSDAPSLFAFLTTHDVTRFIAPPPPTPDAFQRFVAWTRARRAAGEYACFGIVPDGYDTAVGLVQIHMPSGQEPEWGCALGSPFWGSGLFLASAEAVLDFAFQEIGLERLGARSAVANARGNAALRKVGAVRAALLPAGDGQVFDEYYWALTPGDRPRCRVIRESIRH